MMLIYNNIFKHHDRCTYLDKKTKRLQKLNSQLHDRLFQTFLPFLVQFLSERNCMCPSSHQSEQAVQLTETNKAGQTFGNFTLKNIHHL